MDRNKAISRCRLIIHAHEPNAGTWINPNIDYPKLRHALDAGARICRNSYGRSQCVVAFGCGSLLNSYNVLGAEPLTQFLLRFPAAHWVSNTPTGERIAVIGHDLMRLHPFPVVPNFAKLAGDGLRVQSGVSIGIDESLDPFLNVAALDLLDGSPDRLIELFDRRDGLIERTRLQPGVRFPIFEMG